MRNIVRYANICLLYSSCDHATIAPARSRPRLNGVGAEGGDMSPDGAEGKPWQEQQVTRRSLVKGLASARLPFGPRRFEHDLTRRSMRYE